ncbi:probable LRR receptor-like serine/threonine-protein kinase At3g47570 [Dioscorea cayenensis subsp. rotundata]|uniref:Receptor kinase-like protein Xa21 n=1 Tax=Dioscorea cayennensis subsp. rotundata TaxID=55577 RepID=A0AB40CTM7_DIOCR|nr:probable LRR receptor-like serine/threonine-protein kinase At3g47570 [Dioscorea cayenensis subsp. rotundata]
METRGNTLFLLLLCSNWALCVMMITLTVEATLHGNETDRFALLVFKSGITSDPTGVLNSWNNTISVCDWDGVSCRDKHLKRVTSLDLSYRGLQGSISPFIGNLSFLRSVLLMNNGLYGDIPSEFGQLQQLRLINLSFNSLNGVIPASPSLCSELITIQLENNQLSGIIPAELGCMTKLESLNLANNNLTGVIPSSLANLSSLSEVYFFSNWLQGNIPEELGGLTKLEVFEASVNMLSGKIPTQLFNLSSLNTFAAASNNLHGSLSSIDIKLQKLQALYLGENQFTGTIPASLTNISSLWELDISTNSFSGKIPTGFRGLQNLVFFNVISNQLQADIAEDWEFLDSLTNCSQLQFLGFGMNNMGGTLPSSVVNLSTTLQILAIGYNRMTGSLPSGIQNLINLISLDVSTCNLRGEIPAEIGKLSNLQWLGLSSNKFTGQIPTSIGNLTQLNVLNFSWNSFEGHLPTTLGNLQKLSLLDISHNNFTGEIPKEVVTLPYISQYIDLSYNQLEGSLPSEISNLKKLGQLSISGNKLSGEIPATIGFCESLEILALDNNLFRGTIPATLSDMKGLRKLSLSHNNLSGLVPPSLSTLKGLEMLDLSHNNLSGPIPELLQNLNFLFFLNLSYNNFYGEVPVNGVFANSTAISLSGNEGFCGGILQLHLPACPPETKQERKGQYVWLKIIIPIAIAVIFLSIFSLAYWKLKLRKKSLVISPLEEERYPRVTYAELDRATGGFSSDNLVGSGRYGTVYKGSLDNGRTMVAVKVFKLQNRGASKSFLAECKALRAIRHRNLIKIITSCSSVDRQGRDFKALVFEYMPNGSLDQCLHPEDHSHQHQMNHLNLIQRVNIAIDIANALDYLHHNCQPPMVHCDLKPSNMLLNSEMDAIVGDFGISKFLCEAVSEPLQDSSFSNAIKGTVGYVAPDYGAGGQVSISGDVYSYGILLLEMFTGKRPTDDMFTDGMSLRKFVEAGVISEQYMEIIDPKIFGHIEGDIVTNNEIMQINECLDSLLKVGLACSDPSPRERMSMTDVAAKMHAIRNSFFAMFLHLFPASSSLSTTAEEKSIQH